MDSTVMFAVFYIYFVVHNVVGDPGPFRQKRCIVIQKQSGTHGDSAEGEDDDYRRPQPKEPVPDHLRKPQDRTYDAEEIPPELQRLKKRLDRLRLKKTNKYPYHGE